MQSLTATRRRAVDGAERALIRLRYEQGHGLHAVAAEVHRSLSTVRSVLSSQDVPIRPCGWRPGRPWTPSRRSHVAGDAGHRPG